MSEDTTVAERVGSLFENDRFARGSGIRILEVRQGFGRTQMDVEPRHLNAVGIVQGGALFTLADHAFALASNSHGTLAVGCQADITWLKAVRSGRLTATAEEISRTRSISTCLIRILDEREDLVAIFKGIAYIKGTPLDIQPRNQP
jgi:acyl-CoA thioesterase